MANPATTALHALTPVTDATKAAGAVAGAATGAATSAASSAVGSELTSLLGSFGVVPSTVVGGIVKALLYVVFVVAGVALVVLGIARLTGTHPAELAPVVAAAAA